MGLSAEDKDMLATWKSFKRMYDETNEKMYMLLSLATPVPKEYDFENLLVLYIRQICIVNDIDVDQVALKLLKGSQE